MGGFRFPQKSPNRDDHTLDQDAFNGIVGRSAYHNAV